MNGDTTNWGMFWPKYLGLDAVDIDIRRATSTAAFTVLMCALMNSAGVGRLEILLGIPGEGERDSGVNVKSVPGRR